MGLEIFQAYASPYTVSVSTVLAANVSYASGTNLSERVLPDNPESGSPQMAINSYASAYDVSINAVDVWFALPTDGDRGVSWPSLADDKTTIDTILAAMAP